MLRDSNTYFFDLANNPLPLWDEGVWENEPRWTKLWGPIAQELQSCNGYVIVAPEWSGMVPAGLKNFFLFTSADIIGHKPALIVSISASRGGAYPVTELRQSSYKNTRLCYIPEHIIVRDCPKMFLGEEPQSDDDAYIRNRLDYTLKLLNHYALALNSVRESGIIDHKAFPNGM